MVNTGKILIGTALLVLTVGMMVHPAGAAATTLDVGTGCAATVDCALTGTPPAILHEPASPLSVMFWFVTTSV